MGLTVQTVLDEEVAFLLEVGAAVIAHEALGVVELVPGLHDGATAWTDEGRECWTYEWFRCTVREFCRMQEELQEQQENSAFFVNIAHTEEFIVLMDYVHRQC